MLSRHLLWAPTQYQASHLSRTPQVPPPIERDVAYPINSSHVPTELLRVSCSVLLISYVPRALDVDNFVFTDIDPHILAVSVESKVSGIGKEYVTLELSLILPAAAWGLPISVHLSTWTTS
ncbi:hypothetical protein E1B28_007167 [Marasmius oreades]|uniref:Uncharacterized protein n=1 Tax=Marasmius oreades TaxID=181124 RepID=A0A9P7S1A0_9AGAR|nr:uncharacterized protein E1B28_007167 [Marasmius oreades]KAG7093492.1 hypothetical protein E1B28_007167 [Marasmius oreades]